MIKTRSIGPFYSLSSMPIGYGGLLSDTSLSNEEVRSLLVKIVEPTAPFFSINFSPLSKSLSANDKIITPQNTPWTYTHLLDLNKGFEHVWKDHFKANRRRSILKARRIGVEIRRCDSFYGVKAYYAAYLDLAERREIVPRPLILFENIFTQIPDAHLDFLLAKIGEEYVGGIITFFFGGYAYVFLSVCFSRFLKYHVIDLLHSTVIENAVAKGCRFFDFGPSGNLKGIRFFKERFGAKMIPFNGLEVCHPLLKNGVNLYRRVKDLVGG
jgi:lipid II:glycine glycyltransferase (peptidoglycan interpeptide bridge formation enzyme)